MLKENMVKCQHLLRIYYKLGIIQITQHALIYLRLKKTAKKNSKQLLLSPPIFKKRHVGWNR